MGLATDNPQALLLAVCVLVGGLLVREFLIPGVRGLMGRQAERVAAAADAAPAVAVELKAIRDSLAEMKGRLDVVPTHDRRIAVLEDWRGTVTGDVKELDKGLHNLRGRVDGLRYAQQLARTGKTEDDSAG